MAVITNVSSIVHELRLEAVLLGVRYRDMTFINNNLKSHRLGSPSVIDSNPISRSRLPFAVLWHQVAIILKQLKLHLLTAERHQL